MKQSQLIFHFIDEFFLEEAKGKEFPPSEECQQQRWSICESCEHFDEEHKACKYCHCYLPNKVNDQWGDCPLDKWISNSDRWNEEYYDYLKQKIISKYPELDIDGNN